MNVPEHAPRAGDHFIHKRMLRLDSKPPYTAASYETRVVTKVTENEVYHVSQSQWEAGIKKAKVFFRRDRVAESVREWL